MVRFRAALELAQAAGGREWADVVFECGYSDQSHLIREFRRFVGSTPARHLSRAA